MSNRLLGIILLVVGVLLFLSALAADSLGFGAFPGLGWKQIGGAIIGVVVAAVGMVQLRKK